MSVQRVVWADKRWSAEEVRWWGGWQASGSGVRGTAVCHHCRQNPSQKNVHINQNTEGWQVENGRKARWHSVKGGEWWEAGSWEEGRKEEKVRRQTIVTRAAMVCRKLCASSRTHLNAKGRYEEVYRAVDGMAQCGVFSHRHVKPMLRRRRCLMEECRQGRCVRPY